MAKTPVHRSPASSNACPRPAVAASNAAATSSSTRAPSAAKAAPRAESGAAGAPDSGSGGFRDPRRRSRDPCRRGAQGKIHESLTPGGGSVRQDLLLAGGAGGEIDFVEPVHGHPSIPHCRRLRWRT